LLSRNREIRLELGGGARVPRDGEAEPHSAAELRAAGRGVRRVLVACSGGPGGEDLLEVALTAFDPAVSLTVASLPALDPSPTDGDGLQRLRKHAKELGRPLDVQAVKGDPGPALVRLASDGGCDLLVLPLPPGAASPAESTGWERYVVAHAPCRVFLAVSAKDDGEES
jgi:hypothetical protein